MPFTDVWNTAFEGIPADNEAINLGASRIRALKVDIRQRANIDHSWGDAADSGKHLQVTLAVSAVTPTTPSGTDGCVFAETSGGITELFYRDSNGTVTKLTSAGAVASPAAFPSGTALLFAQATPPVGWTQVVTNTDKMLRIVNDGSGGATGGNWTISGLSVATSTTAPAITLSGSVTVNGHALTAAENGPHNHGGALTGVSSLSVTGPGGASAINTSLGGGTVGIIPSDGSGSAHTHGVTNTMSGSASVPTSTSTPSADGAWRPAYLNVISATKN